MLLVAAVGAVVWFLIAPGERFLPAFVRLLTEPVIARGTLSFFSGRSSATGRFRGREVAAHLQLKRSRYGQGSLVVAMRADLDESLSREALDARVRDEAGIAALASIGADGLLLRVDQGWVTVLWNPQGFVIFPGKFSADRWQRTLDDLHAVATSLDRAQ